MKSSPSSFARWNVAVVGLVAGIAGVAALGTQGAAAGGSWWLRAPLMLAEAILLTQFALTMVVSRATVTATPVAESTVAFDAIVLVGDEPADVVRATLLGVRSLRHRESTVVVDHRDRSEIAVLATEFKVGYTTGIHRGRSSLTNEALMHGTAPLVAFFDGDCVPLPHFGLATAGYFAEPNVGFVQCRVEPINRDSLEHMSADRHASSMDHLVIGPARGSHGAAIWQQSGSMVRRSALQGIGGVVDATIGSATLTSIALNRDGWSGRFHADVVCLCVAPNTIDAHLAQRGNEAAARLHVLVRSSSPLVCARLTHRQRLAYVEDLSRPLAACAYLIGGAALIGSVVSGHVPVESPSTLVWAATAAWLVGTFVGFKMVSGSSRAVGDRLRLGLRGVGVDVMAWRRAISNQLRPSMIPPLSGDHGGVHSLASLKLLCAGTLALDAAVICRGLAERFGAGPLTAVNNSGRTALSIGLSLVTMVAVLNVLGVIALRRQLRLNYRLQVELAARIHGDVARVIDLTPKGLGAMTVLPLTVGATVPVSLRVRTVRDASVEVLATGVVRSCDQRGAEWRCGVEIVDISAVDRDRLIEYCSVVHPSRHVAGRDIEVVPEQLAFANAL